MQTPLKEKRRNRRYSVNGMGYQASVAIGNTSFGLNVLDFSANGLQVEIPLATAVPYEGTLHFREQTYHYLVRQVTSDDTMKRLGLEISAIHLEENAPSHCTNGPDLYISGFENKGWKVGNVLFCCIALIGITFALLLLVGPGNLLPTSRLTQLIDSVTPRSFQDNSNLEISGKPSKGNVSSLKARRLQTASDAVSRAQSLFNEENYREVVKACDGAISAANSNVDAWRLRGIALSNLAHYDTAIESLRHALSLNANDPIIHEELAQVYINSAQFSAAIKQSQTGFELAEGEMKLRLKKMVAKAYEARAANREKNDDAEGAQLDRAGASRWGS